MEPVPRYLPRDFPHIPAVYRLVNAPLGSWEFEHTVRFADQPTREFALEIIEQQKNDLYARRAAAERRRAEMLEQWPQLGDDAA